MSPQPSRILVVDDEKLIRWSVGERLTRRGFEVETAESGEQALEVLTARPPEVMLLDVRLPGIDGITTLKRALTSSPNLVVVMMSAHSSVDVAVEAMKDGASDFLVKPFPLALLDAAIDRALATAATRKRVASVVEAPGAGDERAGSMIGHSATFRQMTEMLDRLVDSSATTVLIEGESGAGKELVARRVHFSSSRAAAPFLQINCAALPEQLLESELFGHERGAFTDARVQKHGLFENAAGGSVMLDEIGDLPAGGQAKLLRLLENKTFRRVGGVTELQVDVRVIAATNVDLEARVAEGKFRADLFFRLNVIRIRVPPLRERKDDIHDLASYFLGKFNQELGRNVRGISQAAMDRLTNYRWPGNIRELRNVIERAVILHPHADELRPEHLPSEVGEPKPNRTPVEAPQVSENMAAEPSEQMSLVDNERRLIAEAMDKAHGNQSHAARILGISRDTLRYRLRKHGLG